MTPPVQSTSPALHPYQATFSDEDINEILVAMESQDQSAIDQQEREMLKHERAVSPAPGASAEEAGVSTEQKAQVRSERKRSREKQRRHDVNKQFTDLTSLLRKIETEDDDEGLPRVPFPTGGFTNRVDLIARTSVVLERIHEGNKKRKVENEDLKKQLKDAHKMSEDIAARLKEATLYQQGPPTKPVMMMVPMMVNPDAVGAGGAAGGAQAGAAYPQMAQPFMPQQQMMMMPQMPQMMPQATAQAAPTAAPGPAGQPQMHQQQMPMMPHQMMMQPFNPMMFQQQQQQTAAAVASASATSPTLGAAVPPQGQGKQDPQQGKPSTGGNLAHCA